MYCNLSSEEPTALVSYLIHHPSSKLCSSAVVAAKLKLFDFLRTTHIRGIGPILFFEYHQQTGAELDDEFKSKR